MNWFKRYFQKDFSSPIRTVEEISLHYEKKFHALIENSLDGIVILSEAGKSLYISPSITRILGYSEAEALELDIFSLSHPDDLPQITLILEQLVSQADGPLKEYLGRMRHKDGQWRWLEAKVSNKLQDPSINGIVANFTDVTERKLAEEKLIHANRLYAFLSQINKTIVHVRDEQAVFKEACRIAIEIGGLDIAWIGSFNKETLKVQVVEAKGLNSEEKALFEQIPYDSKEPQHKVLNGEAYFVCNDIQESKLEKWKPIAQVRGINSVIIFPIKKDGQVYGTFNLYSSERNYFNSKEITLLEEATGDISFALEVFEKDKQRLESVKVLKHKDLRFNQAQAIAHLGSWELDFTTGKSIWSDEACRIYGVSLEENELTHEAWLGFIHPEDLDEVLNIVESAMGTFEDTAFYFRIVRADGEVRQLFQQSQFVLDDKGKAIGLYGALHDVTEIKKAEAAIRKSEKALRDMVSFNHTLIEVAPIGIASFNVLTGSCLSVNLAFADIVGANPEELIGLDYRRILSWKESGLLADATKTEETGEIIQKEIFFKSTFGSEKWINYRFVRFFDKDVPHLLLLMNDITERKQAEEALKKSEFQFRKIVETAQEGIWLADEHHTTLFVNRKMCDMLGYSFEEMKGKSVFDYMEDETKKAAVKSMELLEPVKHENVVFLTKNGNRVITMLSSTQFFDGEGKYTGALAMIVDVTEKAKLENLLAKTNRISCIGNYEIDLINETVYWSDIMREIMEVGPEFVPDLSTTNTFYREGEFNVLINHKVRDLIDEGIPYDEELQIVTRKGKIKWVRTIAEAEFVEGKCQRLYGSFQDIDEKKRTQLEVMKVYEEKNNILESIADAFYAVDKNWRVTYWNKEAEYLLGKKRENMVARNLWEEYPELVGSSLHEHYIRAIAENKVQHFEIFYEFLRMWIEISAYPSAGGLSVYFKDITSRKESEMHLRELNRDLETFTKELVISNKNLEQFSYIVSHNLRTPVANIIGLTKVLSDPSLTEEQKDIFTQELTSSVEVLDEVIMDLNHILQKKQELNESRELVVFSKLVKNIQHSISGVIQSENVRIITDFSAVNEYITIKSYFHSIFYNLISNSIKYSDPSRTPIISITSKRENHRIFLSFKDNGTGIDLDKKGDQIFGLYKRFHSHIEGKGMGLFMVKTQVEVLGGKITVKSQPNQGTEFEIEFPEKNTASQE